MGSAPSREWPVEEEESALAKYELAYPAGSEIGLPHLTKKQFGEMAEELTAEFEGGRNAWQLVQQLLFRQASKLKAIEDLASSEGNANARTIDGLESVLNDAHVEFASSRQDLGAELELLRLEQEEVRAKAVKQAARRFFNRRISQSFATWQAEVEYIKQNKTKGKFQQENDELRVDRQFLIDDTARLEAELAELLKKKEQMHANIINRVVQRMVKGKMSAAFQQWEGYVSERLEEREKNRWTTRVKDLEDSTAVLRNSYRDANEKLGLATTEERASSLRCLELTLQLAVTQEEIGSKEQLVASLATQLTGARDAIQGQVLAWPSTSASLLSQLKAIDTAVRKLAPKKGELMQVETEAAFHKAAERPPLPVPMLAIDDGAGTSSAERLGSRGSSRQVQTAR